MRVFNRGATIPFTHTFYDSSGDITSPSSAQLTLSYPTSGWPYRGVMESTAVTLVQNTSTHASAPLGWEGSWASQVAWPGTIYWSIRSNDLTLAVEDGEFQLRGNPANLSITSTT